MKTPIDIEELLVWAFGWEKCKDPHAPRPLVNGFDPVLQWAELQAERRDGRPFMNGGLAWPFMDWKMGGPHPDAECVRAAVRTLAPARVDLAANAEALLGDAAWLIASHLDAGAPEAYASDPAETVHARTRAFDAGAVAKFDGRNARLRRGEVQGGPVVALDAAALVAVHAALISRPDWCEQGLRVHPIIGDRGRPRVVGAWNGRGYYSPGSFCPLEWTPDPLSVARDRATYAVWHDALSALAAMLADSLGTHAPLSPGAAAAPWLGDTDWQARVFDFVGPLAKKPETPARPRAGPPDRRLVHKPRVVAVSP
ncbi:MAG: hypothetical protein WD118_08815 [Phycisphaeraceae bacterium]